MKPARRKSLRSPQAVNEPLSSATCRVEDEKGLKKSNWFSAPLSPPLNERHVGRRLKTVKGHLSVKVTHQSNEADAVISAAS